MIGIIDYGLGNTFAFMQVYKDLSIESKIIKKEEDFKEVDKVILPGVGSFDQAMENLSKLGLIEILNYYILKKNLPFLGICVGMQILAKNSEEGALNGLGWIDAKVKKFNVENLPLPHMGWNDIKILKSNPLFKNLDKKPRFYFLHSYYIDICDNDEILAVANYGLEFPCVIKKENIYGIQFHPEKSHHNGLKILENFGRL